MRIAMLYTPLVTAGGGERQFLEEWKQLRARGHAVTALTFALDDAALFVDGARASDMSVLASRGGWIGQVASLTAALHRIRPGLLVSHTSPELTWLATRTVVVPYVQYHNSPPFYIGARRNPYMASSRYRRVFPRIRKEAAGYEDFDVAERLSLPRRALAEVRTSLKHRALRDARAVVVPSRRTARELRLLHGVDATVLRGCLPAARLATTQRHAASIAPAGRRVVLSVCRLDRVKRLDLLLRAFARVRECIPDAFLVMAGAGPDAARLHAIARASALEDHVRFAGYVPEEQLWAYYAASEVLAAPAMADFIIAPYEAMLAGCRVVWTTEMETDPAIETSGQVFVAEPREEVFADAIVAALNADPGRRADLSGMTWDARGDRLDAILRRAAGRASRIGSEAERIAA